MSSAVTLNNRPVMEITSQAVKLHIKNKRPVFKVKHIRPMLRIEKKAPSFKVNRLNYSAKNIRPSFLQKTERYNDEAYKKVMETIARMAHMGESLVNIHGRQNIMEIFFRQSAIEPLREADATALQESFAEFEWDPGYLRIEWTDYNLEIEWDLDNAPEIFVEPYMIEVKVRNKPAVRIREKRNTERNAVGKNIDRKI